MLVNYLTVNFWPIMILLALIAIMIVNRDVKIPATKLFVVSILVVFALTVAGTFDIGGDVSALAAKEAQSIVTTRTIACVIMYVLRPIVILAELIIVLHDYKYKYLCVIPAIFNAVVYMTTLFGAKITFWIDEENHWHGGPLKYTIYCTLLLYLFLLLLSSVHSFTCGEKRKSLILIVMFVQAVLVAIHENGNTDQMNFTDATMALGLFEYYVYLTNVYRQKLNEKLDSYVYEIEESGIKLKSLTIEVMEALASAIDAKDKYTHGHSSRVAEYSRKLAGLNGKTEKECDEIYYAALLHDVGKIGVPDAIITKEGKLTKEEYEEIKKHPELGTQILKRISAFPFLCTGAGGHHERYDGKGYPNGLKGTDIPEIARIISVADAYDAMTSKRSYRDPIPQQIVREELVKGIGTQFDPDYARLMLQMVDIDTEYEMCDRGEVVELDGKDELIIDGRRSRISAGILLNPCLTTIRMKIGVNEKTPDVSPQISLVLFDSLDGRVHVEEKEVKDLNYYEYGELWPDGKCDSDGVRRIQTNVFNCESSDVKKDSELMVEAVRIKDHALVRIIGKNKTIEYIIALPDSARFLYLGLTGEHARISKVTVDKAEKESPANYIPRIAEEISFIKDEPAGDIPNVQIDGYHTDFSESIEIKDGLKVSFHSKNIPTARLVWHCPCIDIFTSDDGKVNGENFLDIAFLRFDGEAWSCIPNCAMKLNATKRDNFEGWDAWKTFNKEGFDATVSFAVRGNKITITTENAGIFMKDVLTITDIDSKIYATITGDQVAITDIHIN